MRIYKREYHKIPEMIKKENKPCMFFINKAEKEEGGYQKALDDIVQNVTKKAVNLTSIKNKEVNK